MVYGRLDSRIHGHSSPEDVIAHLVQLGSGVLGGVLAAIGSASTAIGSGSATVALLSVGGGELGSRLGGGGGLGGGELEAG